MALILSRTLRHHAPNVVRAVRTTVACPHTLHNRKLSKFVPRSSRTGVTQKLWEDRVKSQAATSVDEASQTEPVHLVDKTPSESACTVVLSFSSDEALKEQYVSVYGGVRHGKIFEDLDALACNVANTHADDNNPATRPLSIVTASCDRIDLIKRLSIESDITMAGAVTYVGRSSMEVEVTLMQDGNTSMHASFTLVALDSNKKSAPINGLIISTEEENQQFQEGKLNKEQKKLAAATSLKAKPPNEEEVAVIHDFFTSSSVVGSKSTLTNSCTTSTTTAAMVSIGSPEEVHPRDTIMKSVTFCHAQHRNMKSSIFGGYLMLLSYELAWASAHTFVRGRPSFRAVDEISFLKPVAIGDIVECTATVVYTEHHPHPSVQIRVLTDVIDPATGDTATTNVSHYTFDAPASRPIRKVVPVTYAEAMDYLDERRRHKRAFIVGAEK